VTALRGGRARGGAPNQVRIIGGTHRSRVIRFPEGESLRPTPDRVRETLFNWLGQDLSGLACLDLFAGSGALGFEAASRHARSVVLVERDAAVVRALRDNARLLDLPAVEVVAGDAIEFVRYDKRVFDVVFVDPPYQGSDQTGVLSKLVDRLAPGARLYVEAPRRLEPGEGWSVLRHLAAGQVHAHLIQAPEK
jgi:16S rRNA (guanine966-N2)-methyltransferase